MARRRSLSYLAIMMHRNDRRRTVALLGSTGSVGGQTVELLKRGGFEVVLLVCNSNVDAMAKQVAMVNPKFAVVLKEDRLSQLQNLLSHTETRAMAGHSAVVDVLSDHDVDVTIVALSGFGALDLAIEAVKHSKIVGMANKESIVCAWGIIESVAMAHGTKIIPIDSEHNSIAQVAHDRDDIKKITITASGGPFLDLSLSQLENVSVSEAVRHPNWSMGKKISIDSATMMNKALEMVEARNLFKVDCIEALIHRESIVHCIVEFCDTFCAMGASLPNMMLHIAHALSWPRRLSMGIPGLDLVAVGKLHFGKVDVVRFPAMALVKGVLKHMGNYPIIMNAANEVAVHMFIDGVIKFTDIVEVVDHALQNISHDAHVGSLEIIKHYDRVARDVAIDFCEANFGINIRV